MYIVSFISFLSCLFVGLLITSEVSPAKPVNPGMFPVYIGSLNPFMSN